MDELASSKRLTVRAVAMIATAVGAVAVGAFAIGALAIGRLAIRRIVIDNAELKNLKIEDLTVTRLRAAEVTITDSLEVPATRISSARLRYELRGRKGRRKSLRVRAQIIPCRDGHRRLQGRAYTTLSRRKYPMEREYPKKFCLGDLSSPPAVRVCASDLLVGKHLHRLVL